MTRSDYSSSRNFRGRVRVRCYLDSAQQIQTLAELCFIGHFGPQIGNVQTTEPSGNTTLLCGPFFWTLASEALPNRDSYVAVGIRCAARLVL
jgi:hypothetical protein